MVILGWTSHGVVAVFAELSVCGPVIVHFLVVKLPKALKVTLWRNEVVVDDCSAIVGVVGEVIKGNDHRRRVRNHRAISFIEAQRARRIVAVAFTLFRPRRIVSGLHFRGSADFSCRWFCGATFLIFY